MRRGSQKVSIGKAPREALIKSPKPFIFVLMPFEEKFDDIYKFGIKGAAEDVGAYAERLDEQVFTEGMLDRIFNQISKADVIVADMTGRNPNVFYEVGYAHALGKIVLLITQTSEDIPFDLKHRQHTPYGGKIEILRKELSNKLAWAIQESRIRGGMTSPERISVRLHSTEMLILPANAELPIIEGTVSDRQFTIPLSIRNDSPDAIIGFSHVYLFMNPKSVLVPSEQHRTWPGVTTVNMVTYIPSTSLETVSYDPIDARDDDSADGLSVQYRLPIAFEKFPPGAIEQRYIGFHLDSSTTTCDELMRLRLHSEHQYWEYRFRIKINFRADVKKE